MKPQVGTVLDVSRTVVNDRKYPLVEMFGMLYIIKPDPLSMLYLAILSNTCGYHYPALSMTTRSPSATI